MHGNDDLFPSSSSSCWNYSTRQCLVVAILCVAMGITPNNSRIASSARRTLIHGWVIFFHFVRFFSACRSSLSPSPSLPPLLFSDSRFSLIAISLLETINYFDKKWRPSSPRVKYISILHRSHTDDETAANFVAQLDGSFLHRNCTLNSIQQLSVVRPWHDLFKLLVHSFSS